MVRGLSNWGLPGTEPAVRSAAPHSKLTTFGRWGERAALALTLSDTIHTNFVRLRDYWQRNMEYSVTVTEKDPIYSHVHEWLASVLPEERHRAVKVLTGPRDRRRDYVEPEETSSSGFTPPPLTVQYNTTTRRKMVIAGHPVNLSVINPEIPESGTLSREPVESRILFTMRNYAAQQAVLKELERLNADRAVARKAALKMVGQWGGWRTRSDLPPRTLDSVILPAEQKRRVVKDLGDFLGAEEKYNRLALPWHRGYMFHGPPGTGKTSLVKALANEFNLDLWYISLSDLKAESGLLGLLAEVGPRSILLLEDIDTMRITHDRDGSDQGVISMSSLLNTLDGVATPHGLITMMTTNRFEMLDPALTRAGRMDLVEMLDYPSRATVGEMFRHFYGKGPNWGDFEKNTDPIQGLSTSQVSEVMKRHMDDPDGARAEVYKLLDKSGMKE